MSSGEQICSDCELPVDDRGCSRCWWKTPLPKVIRRTSLTIHAGGGGPPPPVVPVEFAGYFGSSTSSGETTITIPNVDKPAGTFLAMGIGRAWNSLGVGANDISITLAGQAVSRTNDTKVEVGAASYRMGLGIRVSGAALNGDLVATFSGVIPDVKFIIAVVLDGTALDFNQATTISTSNTLSYTSPGIVPSTTGCPSVVFQCSAATTAQAAGQWGSGWTDGGAKGVSGVLDLSASVAYRLTNPGFSVTKTGFSSHPFYFVVHGVTP